MSKITTSYWIVMSLEFLSYFRNIN